MEKKYYNIEKYSLAQALNFMGFKYYIFTGDSGKTIYGFEDTEKFRVAFDGLLKLREQIRN